MRLHLFAHNQKNFVKVGDKVEQYKTKIGSIGTGNGSYYAHLHHSISEGLDVEQLRAYVDGWSEDKVEMYYENVYIDYDKMFGRTMDVGNLGWDWLDNYGEGFHPGLDINGKGGGNTDLGYEYTSSCDGKVIYVNNTNSKDGWGKMVIVEETNNSAEEMDKKYKAFYDKKKKSSGWKNLDDWIKGAYDYREEREKCKDEKKDCTSQDKRIQQLEEVVDDIKEMAENA